MTCSEALCYGVFSSYPVISLALNSIPMPTREEGRLNTGTRCLLFCGDGRVIAAESQERYYMQVHVCVCCGWWLACEGLCENLCCSFSYWVLKTQEKRVCLCVSLLGSLWDNIIITLIQWGPLTRDGDWLLVKDEKQCHTCVQSYNTATWRATQTTASWY